MHAKLYAAIILKKNKWLKYLLDNIDRHSHNMRIHSKKMCSEMTTTYFRNYLKQMHKPCLKRQESPFAGMYHSIGHIFQL
jgi:hypothetical protein